MLTCENEQFHLLGPFSLHAVVKRVSEINRQDDCIGDGKAHLSYSRGIRYIEVRYIEVHFTVILAGT